MSNPTAPVSPDGTPTYQYGTHQYPNWGEQLQGQFGDTISGMLSAYSGLDNNWYNQPLTVGPNSLQMQGYQGAQDPYQWQGGLQQAVGALSAYSDPYNQAELQQYMNPYTGGVVDEIGRLGREKLTDDMNNINSTFTSGGGFGGTRNRSAILDAQQRNSREVLGAQRTALDQAYDTANQNYFQWAGRPLQAATAWGNLANTGANLNWQDINNQTAVGNNLRNIEQSGYDANYKDWQTQLQTPLTMLGGLSQVFGNTAGKYWSNPNTANVTQNQQPGYNNIDYLLALLQGFNGATQG